MNVIETKSLTKSYGKARGIVDLTLSVEQGEWFGFIGPNGAGKSTTIRTLLGLIFPSSGSAKVLGLDVVKQKEEILRRTGYLPSEALFYPGMRVKDILKFSADLRKKDCSKTAAALQSKPDLLILDEPTSGLDPLMQHEFFEIIREYNKEGTTVFVSSHILPEIQRNCDRAGVIREGRLIACDSVEALGRSSAKRVSFRGNASVDGLAGIKDISVQGETRSFLYGGDINALIGRLSGGSLKDLTITDPDLDEIFMHFYGSNADKKAAQEPEFDSSREAKTQEPGTSTAGKEEK